MTILRILLPLLLLASAAFTQGFPQGGQFQVNTTIDDFQEDPAIATDGAGNFVVVWTNEISSVFSISGQRFFANGTPNGSEFPVNTLVADELREPAVAMASDGRFVVIWYDDAGLDGSGWGVHGQRFTAGAVPMGSEMAVNSYFEGPQGQPSVAMRDDGSFVVVWMGSGYHTSHGVSGKAYAWDGTELWGGQFGVNTHEAVGGVQRPHVAIAADGRFVVTWDSYQSPGDDSSGQSVQARCFAWGLATSSAQFQVNTTTSSDQSYSDVAMAPDGSFLVAYYGLANYGIGGQFYNPSCAPDGTELELNDPSGFAARPDLTVDDHGNYVLSWAASGNYARLFPASGTPSERFDLPSHTFPTQWAKIAATPNGELVATWQSNGSNGTDHDIYSIQARRFAAFTAIFFDGFESGDVNAWSDARP